MTASSMRSGFPFSRSATTIMCLAKRLGTENVSGNDWSRKSRRSKGRSDDDVAVVELAGDEAPAVPPVEQAVAATLGDAVELSGQPAEVGETHRLMVAWPLHVR
jgi:hypothetical protein